ncbi:MAG: PD-(D/E)XK nuclease family protein, partial [Proteobacteria bacterium]|nr:PD-(D/E)XK nuclease family protein [Pseudomonadota bacterium]
MEPAVLLLPQPRGEALLLWSALPRADEPAPLQQEREARRAVLMGEYRRLLYVGMTRAADRLYIVSHAGKPSRKEIDGGVELPDPEDALEASWFQMLRRGLPRAEAFGPEAVLDEGLPPRRKLRLATQAPIAPPAEAPKAIRTPIPLPDWAHRPLPPEHRPDTLSPSARVAPLAPSAGQPFARRRGIVLHKLFELLPRVPPAQQQDVGLRLLPLIAPELESEAREAFLSPVLELLASQIGQRYFAPTSRAEVAVSGDVTLPDGRVVPVLGRIDRLSITPEAIEILDLKTGRPHAGADNHGIVTQMALYRALLGGLYPGRTLRCHILWLEGGRIETLPEAVLDQALIRLGHLT